MDPSFSPPPSCLKLFLVVEMDIRNLNLTYPSSFPPLPICLLHLVVPSTCYLPSHLLLHSPIHLILCPFHSCPSLVQINRLLIKDRTVSSVTSSKEINKDLYNNIQRTDIVALFLATATSCTNCTRAMFLIMPTLLCSI